MIPTVCFQLCMLGNMILVFLIFVSWLTYVIVQTSIVEATPKVICNQRIGILIPNVNVETVRK